MTRRRWLAVTGLMAVVALAIVVGPGASGPGPRPPVRSSRPAPAGTRVQGSVSTRGFGGPPWTVATTTVRYDDATRSTPTRGSEPAHAGRTLSTVLRWPTTTGGQRAPGPHPLVVFAHGYAAETSTYTSLLDDLAAAGAIVAAPELPGQSSALAGAPNETDLVNEPCDLEFVARSVMRSPPAALAGATAAAAVVFVGHSDGATAAAAAGYQLHACDGPRAVAVVALSVRDIVIDAGGMLPVLLAVTGTADEVNPASNTAKLWSHVPAPAWLLTVDGGTHLGTFTTDPDRARIDALIASFVRAHTVDPGATVDVTAIGRLHLATR